MRCAPPHVPVTLLVEAPGDGYPPDLAGRLQQSERRRQRRALAPLATFLAETANGGTEYLPQVRRIERVGTDHVEDGRAQPVDLGPVDPQPA